jgi:hypothetical protein
MVIKQHIPENSMNKKIKDILNLDWGYNSSSTALAYQA